MHARLATMRASPTLSLLVLVAMLVCASKAKQLSSEEWDKIKSLDLSKMKAHTETAALKGYSSWKPKSQALLQNFTSQVLACEESTGKGALPYGSERSDGNATEACCCPGGKTGSGGFCDGLAAGDRSAKGKTSWLGKEVPGSVACSAAAECADMLYERMLGIDKDRLDCNLTHTYLSGVVQGIEAAFRDDVQSSRSHKEAVGVWLDKMEAQNELMVKELGRYTSIQRDYSRLSKEEAKVREQYSQLKARLTELEDEYDALEKTRVETAGRTEANGKACRAKIDKLKGGLEAAGVAVPKLH